MASTDVLTPTNPGELATKRPGGVPCRIVPGSAHVCTEPPPVLVVHHRRGVIEVPLTGDARLDGMLRRFAARGGFVVPRRA